MKINHIPVFVLLLALSACMMPARALMGIGAHAIMDLSMGMDDAEDIISFDKRLILGTAVADTSIDYVLSRSGWQRTKVNYGGKIFVDVIPVIDAFEISVNFGVWEYDCRMTYPVLDNHALSTATRTISFDALNIQKRWGVGSVPFARLHADFTIRKYVFRIPKDLKLLSMYAGGGLSFIASTPVVGRTLFSEAFSGVLVNDTYNMYDVDDTDLISSEGALKAMLNKTGEGLTERRGGLHFITGLFFQIPVVPLAIYGDVKGMLPMGEIGAEAGLGGFGLMFNAGIALSVPGMGESHHAKGFK